MNTDLKPCECHSQLNAKLKEQGLKFSDKVVGFAIVKNTLSARFNFPLTTMDGKKPKSGKPAYMFLSFCPFCGQQIERE